MIITKDMYDKKVPKEMIPKRLDSATDLYTNTKKGLTLYNIKPDTWNVLYPFFQQGNKFTMDDFEVLNDDLTFGELINLYMDIYHKYYELELGFYEEKRKSVLTQEFNETFGVSGTKISKKLDAHYELKFSKSKNVYTLYYLESYIASYIDDVDKLLNQNVYAQELLDLSQYPIPKEVNGVKLVDSLSILNDLDNLNLVRNSEL